MRQIASKGTAFLVILCPELLFSNLKKKKKQHKTRRKNCQRKKWLHEGKLLFTICGDLIRTVDLKEVP